MKTTSLLLGMLQCLFWTQLRSQTAFEQKIADLMEQVSQDSIAMHIENLANADGHQTRASYTDGNIWAVNYIKQTFERMEGLTSVELDTFFVSTASPPFNSDPLFNVIATLQGNGDASEYYVIGGHLDATSNRDGSLNWDTDWPTAKAPGADDNASGIAAILEIARLLSDPANGSVNDITIKFIAFGAEEFHPIYSGHHLGSRYFVQKAYQNGDDILGAYIVDMIGYNNTGHDYFNIVSNTNSRSLGDKMLEVNSVYQVGLESNQPPFPSATYSDHDQFWNYRYNAILLIENAPPWENTMPFYQANPTYHTQGDVPSVVNLDQVEKMAKLTLATIATLTGPQKIAWQKGEPSNYEFDALFDTVAVLPHGIVTDRFSRIWIGSFSAAAPGLIVRNPDGSEAPFSPITSVTLGAETIPLDDGGCRGMAVDADGNILYAKASTLLRINAETGEGISSWEGSASLTKPAVDADGNVYVGTVSGVSPIVVLEPVFFTEIAQIELNPVAGLARGIETSADGKNLWTGNLTFGGPVYQYTTEDFVTYPVSDSIFIDADGDTIFQFAITTVDWGPDSTLWFSHETENPAMQTENGLVVFDFDSQTYTTLFMPELEETGFNGPRGVAFSVTGDTAYVASFNGSRVLRFVRDGTVSVEDKPVVRIPTDFELGQNYPNPFNPTTTIPFKLSKPAQVELKIYNVQGQFVRTLIDQFMQAGQYNVNFDASGIASGAYYYQLSAGGVVFTRRMIFLK